MALGRTSRRVLAGALVAGLGIGALAGLGPTATAVTETQCVTKPLVAGAPTTKLMTIGDSVTRGASGDYLWRYFVWRHLVTDGNPSSTPTSPTQLDMVGAETTVLDPYSGAELTDVRCPFDMGTDAQPGIYGSLAAYAAQETSVTNPLVKVPHVRNLVHDNGANVLIVAAGLQDLTSTASPVTADQALTLAHTVASGAQSANPDIKILFLTVPQAAQNPPAKVVEYNSSLLSAAASWSTTKSAVAAVSAATSWSDPSVTYDGVHPNPNGEVAIASAVVAGLRSLAVPGAAPAFVSPGTLPVGPRDPAVLATPQVSGNTVNLSWQLPPGSVVSQVQRVDVNAGNGWQNLPDGRIVLPDNASGPPYTSTATDTIQAGRTYQYRIVAAKSTYTLYKLYGLAQFSQTVTSNVVTVPEGATLPTVPPTTPTPTITPSTPTPTVTATSTPTPPAVVVGVGATPTVHGTRLVWSPRAGATGYRFIWFVKGRTQTIFSKDTTSTGYSVTGLVPGVPYGFRVRALVGDLQGPLSATVYVTPKPFAMTSPKPRLSTLTKHRIKVAWPTVAHATAYEVQLRLKGSKSWRVIGVPKRGPVTTTTLLKRKVYEVRLRPYDAYSPGRWSATARVTTK